MQQHWLTACLLLTCPRTIKVFTKWCNFIVITVLQYILITYFCIDYLNRTVFSHPVARQLLIQPSGQKVWLPLL